MAYSYDMAVMLQCIHVLYELMFMNIRIRYMASTLPFMDCYDILWLLPAMCWQWSLYISHKSIGSCLLAHIYPYRYVYEYSLQYISREGLVGGSVLWSPWTRWLIWAPPWIWSYFILGHYISPHVVPTFSRQTSLASCHTGNWWQWLMGPLFTPVVCFALPVLPVEGWACW